MRSVISIILATVGAHLVFRETPSPLVLAGVFIVFIAGVICGGIE